MSSPCVDHVPGAKPHGFSISAGLIAPVGDLRVEPRSKFRINAQRASVQRGKSMGAAPGWKAGGQPGNLGHGCECTEAVEIWIFC